MNSEKPRKFKDEVVPINPLEPIKKIKERKKREKGARVIFVSPTPEEERVGEIKRKIEEEKKAKKKRKEHPWRGDITDVRFN